MRFIGRIIWAGLTFVIAALVGAGVAAVIGLELLTRAANAPRVASATDADQLLALIDRGWMMLVNARLLGPILAGSAGLAALALVISGEVLRIRSFLYYLLGGGLALAAGPLLMQAHELPAALPQTLAVAGFAAGAVYWLLAGRRA